MLWDGVDGNTASAVIAGTSSIFIAAPMCVSKYFIILEKGVAMRLQTNRVKKCVASKSCSATYKNTFIYKNILWYVLW